jgi:hypothetical protein
MLSVTIAMVSNMKLLFRKEHFRVKPKHSVVWCMMYYVKSCSFHYLWMWRLLAKLDLSETNKARNIRY